MPFEPWQLGVVIFAALLLGFSKTGLPGTGILAVPLMGSVFGGHLSIGATVPLLILADCFAVAFYRLEADWGRLRSLIPFVFAGLILGALFLRYLPHPAGTRDPLNPIIGWTVLVMLAIQLVRRRWANVLLPTSPLGTAATGVASGFTTMASNAAGPIMSIYLTAAGMSKSKLMGTTAWYFFIFNIAKIPFIVWLNWGNPADPVISRATLTVDFFLVPVIVIGALLGKKLLPIIPERLFTQAILGLAAVAAVRLIVT